MNTKKSFLLLVSACLFAVLQVETVIGQQLKTSKKAQAAKAAKLKKSQQGALIGVGAGAIIGGLIGRNSKNTAIGAIIGATVGGAAGAVIGQRMDKQAEQLAKDLDKLARVERIGEGVKLTFDSALLFDFGVFELRTETQENLRKMVQTLKADQQTQLLVEGHTDNAGSADFNRQLATKRAQAVSNFLLAEGITGDRFKVVGQGEANPVATNTTESGRQQNRRVEIGIYASEEMKKSVLNELLNAK